MAANARARRSSPPPGNGGLTSRYPRQREEHMDADEKRAQAAVLGYAPRRSKPLGGLDIASGEWKALVVVVLVAAAVRLYRLSKPNSVVFDEVHFGKFAGKYIKTQYFVDVHPPLAKLLITLAAFVFGYDGEFDFKDIAKAYDHVPYVAMRMVPAVLGIATIPISYLTLRALDCRATTSLLAALMITFENGLITQSRHILLDSPLVFFTALTTFLWCGFCNEDKNMPFTKRWWTWLALTGTSLGAVLSCKWVGLFTIATIGVSTVYQLWNLLGDLRVSANTWVRHFYARAICLIIIPMCFYMMMFQIHFMILENSGDGDGFMSSEFQHTLGGRHMKDTFADVAIGSTITIRHVNTQGGYLHSHEHGYPGGSKQQQITLYPHRDSNNDWQIVNATSKGDADTAWENEPLQYITPGARVKLRHATTSKHLHSHDIRPPVSDVEFQNEVSGYGMPGFAGDMNDDWTVEIEEGDRSDSESWKRLRTLRTKFRLRHALTGCYLFSHKVKLPEWGFEQQEVTCNKNAVMANSLWVIETNTNPKLQENAPKVNYRLPGFLSKFIELQEVMWTTNQGLTARHAFDSRPEHWPILRRGINFWVKDHRQIYLIGNPVVWYLSTWSILVYVAVRGLLLLRQQRGFRDFENTKVVKYDGLCGFLFIGWALHYLPFYLMGRQLFLHHYFPALYFSILLWCSLFDLATATLRPRVRLQVAGGFLVVVIIMYSYFSPLTYGTPWTKAQCHSAQWLPHWDFACNEYYDDIAQYKGITGATPTKAIINKPHTATILGQPQKAEPGKDIFADHPHLDIKSDSRPPPPAMAAPKDPAAAAAAQNVQMNANAAAGELKTEAKKAPEIIETAGQPGAKAETVPAKAEFGGDKVLQVPKEEVNKDAAATTAGATSAPAKDAASDDIAPQDPVPAKSAAPAKDATTSSKDATPAQDAPPAEPRPLMEEDVEADRVAKQLYENQ